MASGGASRLDKRLPATKHFPAQAAQLGYFTPDNLGINIVEVTLFANTAQVNAVGHSLNATPAGWWGHQIAALAAAGARNIQLLEASAPNNSVVGLFAYGHSVSDTISIGARVYFLPPNA